MRTHWGETAMGFLVLALAVAFLVWSLDVTQAGRLGGGYRVSAKFGDVGGLQPGAKVSLAGVKVGSVSGVRVDPKSFLAVVQISLDGNVHVPADSTAKVTSDGLLGGAHIAVTPGGAEDDLKPGGEFANTQGSVDLFGLIGQMIRPHAADPAPAANAAASADSASAGLPPVVIKAEGRGRDPLRWVNAIGRTTLGMAAAIGRVVHFAGRGLYAVVTPRWFPQQVLRQLGAIGFLSLPVVGLTAWFTGAALALNIYSGGDRFNADQVMAQIVALGITRELGPVLAALMLAGRVSAAIASEIGAMRATEQIDAMVTLSTDPFRYLIAPRLLAAIITLPLLALVADIIGIAGGWQVAIHLLGTSPQIYIANTASFLTAWDVESGLIKSAVFGFIVGLMGCYHGMNATGGARGVGRATTQAVVSSAILILAFDYLLTSLFTHL